MKYSIIIPVYNVDSKLNRCIDSIIKQEFDDYEIILVNDGSNDSSGIICDNYSEKYSNVFVVHQKNGGVSKARNTGLDISKGKYILFVDSDDYVDECYFENIERVVGIADLVVFTYSWIKGNRINKRNISADLVNEINFFNQAKELMLSRTINSPCAKVFERDIIDKYGIRFDERMPVAEDFVFCCEYLMKCNNVYIDNSSIYFYDVTNDNSLVHKKKIGLIDIYPITFDRVFELIDESRFNDEHKKQLFRVWDKLHTDSFATCVMEELKDNEVSYKQVKGSIEQLCVKFYSQYNVVYGYENLVHFFVRFCIKYRITSMFYLCGRIYIKLRNQG